MSDDAVSRITLRPLDDGDRFLLARWLKDPHVIAWFGSAAAADAALTIARDAPSSLMRIILREERPIGFVQAVDASDLGNVHPLPPSTMELDGFIGEPALRGQGFGMAAFTALRNEVFATTLMLNVAVLVPISREDAVRRLEQSGFAWRRIVSDTARGRCWLMISERGRTERPM